MVDLEAHVAPELDDGAATRDTALEMCRLAARTGTRELVVAVRTKLEEPFARAGLESIVDSLQQELGDALYLHSSCVIHLTPSNASRVYVEPERYAINSLRYLPFELSGELLARGGLGDMFLRFRDAGLAPIIARPERTGGLRSDIKRLRHWVNLGVFIQVTAGSLTGLYGERAQMASIELIDANLAHFVASCGRSTGGRAPILAHAYDMVVYRWGEKVAQRLFIDNPWAALWGEDIDHPAGRRGGISALGSFRR